MRPAVAASNQCPQTPRWSRLRVVAGSVGGGLILATAFPPLGWWLLAPVGVALITLGAQARGLRAALLSGFLAGVAFFLTTLWWLSVVGYDAWLALGGYCAAWFIPLAAVAWLVRAVRWSPLIVAAVWMVDEAGRGRIPWGGFAWSRLAFSQADAPTATLGSLGGMPLIGFVVALAGTLLAWWISHPARLRSCWQPVVAIIIVAMGALLPRPTVGQAVGPAVGQAVGQAVGPAVGQSLLGPAEVTVALIQGSVPDVGLDAMSQRRAVLDNHVAATKQLAREVAEGRRPRPQLVIWPENSSDLDPISSAEAATLIDQAVSAIGVPILVGAVIIISGDPVTLGNAGIVWNPGTGAGDRYLKRHLVPFGEFVPWRPILTRLIGRYERVPYDFAPGTDSGVLQVGPARLADVICFEVADDGVVRQEVRDGGRALAVQTNNATYAATSQPEQQLAMSRLRAIEHGRSVMVAATSGITAVISADGSVISEARLNASQSLVDAIQLRDSLTISDRIGILPEILFLGIVLAGLFRAVVRRRRNDGQPDAPVSSSVVDGS